MSTFQKPSEIAGWMFHAPAKPAGARHPVEVPPASQIPGLAGGLYLDLNTEDPPRRGYIKESDSPYTRMAKLAGREDLLRFKENKPKSAEPKGYPKVDWYYLEDNKVNNEEQEAKKDKPYEFQLPEYMVHHEAKPRVRHEDYDAKRAPYAFDKTTVFQREGDQATDKKVKVAEEKRPGYGVRSQKLKGKTVEYNMPKVERGKPPGEPKQKTPKPVSESIVSMGKLLAFGYGKDWEDENGKYHNKLQKAQAKLEQTHIGGADKVQTEYEGGYRKASGGRDNNKDRKSKESPKLHQKNTRTDKGEQELFKLSKFLKVPARTDHTRHNPSNSGGTEMVPVA